jgi:2-methylcitrate dehydratase PrpD
MGSDGGLTAWLGRYIADGRLDRVPEPAIESAGQLVLDTVGVALAGAREPAARIAAAVVRAEGGAPRALLLGTTSRTSPTGAALANGTAAHALDLDDSHHPGFVHPSAVLLPALLALAEDRDAGGRRLLVSHLYGLDVAAALGNALNIGHYALGWHATATLGTLAAAAACAKLLDLPAERTAVALSLAASQAGGVRRNFGSMAKPLHAGLAASAGMRSALLAEAGLSAGAAVLEGERGLFDLLTAGAGWHERDVRSVLDHRFELALAGLAIKRFASCGVTHPPIEAALQLRDEHGVTAPSVRRLDLVVNPRVPEIAAHDRPSSGLEAKFSLPHCLAVALLDGGAGLEQFTDDRATEPTVVDLGRRVHVTVDPGVGLTGHMSWGCRLTATLADGRTVQTEVEMARGKWLGERLTRDELVAKFRGCAAAAGIAPEPAEHTLALLEGLDALPRVRELGRSLERAAA